MTVLLHLDSSASRTDHSVSRQLTTLFADTWRSLHGSAGYRYRDLAADPIPLITADYVALGTRVERHGVIPMAAVDPLINNTGERGEWTRTQPLITELLAADTVLIGVPMYNFSVPAALKAWIDRVSFPGAFDNPDTGNKRLWGTKVVLVAARGGSYEPGAPREGFDFQVPYLRTYFTNLGIAEDNLTVICADLTRSADIPHLARFTSLAARSLTAARRAVIELASTLGEAVTPGQISST